MLVSFTLFFFLSPFFFVAFTFFFVFLVDGLFRWGRGRDLNLFPRLLDRGDPSIIYHRQS
jgi:hypothetical protein